MSHTVNLNGKEYIEKPKQKSRNAKAKEMKLLKKKIAELEEYDEEDMEELDSKSFLWKLGFMVLFAIGLCLVAKYSSSYGAPTNTSEMATVLPAFKVGDKPSANQSIKTYLKEQTKLSDYAAKYERPVRAIELYSSNDTTNVGVIVVQIENADFMELYDEVRNIIRKLPKEE